MNACDVFVYTEILQASADGDSRTEVAARTPLVGGAAETKVDSANNPAALKRLLRTAFELAVQEDGWATLAVMGGFLRQLDPGFDPRTYGHKQLMQLVQAYPQLLETRGVKSKNGSAVISVRLKASHKPPK